MRCGRVEGEEVRGGNGDGVDSGHSGTTERHPIGCRFCLCGLVRIWRNDHLGAPAHLPGFAYTCGGVADGGGCDFAKRPLPFGEYAVTCANAMVSKENRLKLALETGFSLRTIEKWSQGKPVSESTDRALRKATEELEDRQPQLTKEA